MEFIPPCWGPQNRYSYSTVPMLSNMPLCLVGGGSTGGCPPSLNKYIGGSTGGCPPCVNRLEATFFRNICSTVRVLYSTLFTNLPIWSYDSYCTVRKLVTVSSCALSFVPYSEASVRYSYGMLV